MDCESQQENGYPADYRTTYFFGERNGGGVYSERQDKLFKIHSVWFLLSLTVIGLVV
uniref:Uncharacterized protein n=1 Tax=Candidatus Nitrotoga fabula TaxID=2182327 RepID=A0A2X0QXL7_9PROT|nr:protein of unknown function [Candidatus Nitrotoga fabula]